MPRPPPVLLPWLTCETSLTDELMAASGCAKLIKIKEEWGVLSESEQQVFALAPTELWRREIQMQSVNEVCWYARTLIPIVTYHAHAHLFKRLQQESLGELIYNNQLIKRKISYHTIAKDSPQYGWVSGELSENSKTLWVRTSLFTFPDKEVFYLMEIFLPGLLRILG